MSNPEFWVEVEGLGRCRLLGNAHTFPGRISAWSETLGQGVTISRSEIREAADDVWAWIDGFLSGNEPELHEFLGIEPYEAMEIDDHDESSTRWLAALDTFRRTGQLPFPLNPLPRKPPPDGLSAEPWVLVGGLVMRWDGATWVPQRLQPELHFGLLAGTVCDERGHCLMEEGNEDFAACRDCGNIDEIVPGA